LEIAGTKRDYGIEGPLILSHNMVCSMSILEIADAIEVGQGGVAKS
jgi:hypothetical protein